MNKGVASWYLVAMVVVLAAAVHQTMADCNPTALTPCIAAITGGTNPSPDCCSKLKEQVPTCYCGYLNDPDVKPYLSSPNTAKVVASCGVSIPKC